ncbi:MAG: GNAT family N-acetyltransferase [Flavobacteriaceae bacterium]|nr:GNAT family N-acetyltransferase [Flavobacteriaceae bacterium]
MKIISIREHPQYEKEAIQYFQNKWPSVAPQIYYDAIHYALTGKDNLPQWYLLQKNDEIIGCAGLITNDFISRGDLYPWLCALFIEEEHRGNAYPKFLFEKAKSDTKAFGFKNLYLSTSHVDYYERYGFEYIGDGFHPWNETSRIYSIKV